MARSIRVRTTVGATVVVGVALVVAGLLVVLLLRRDLTASVDAAAELRVEDLVAALDAGGEPETSGRDNLRTLELVFGAYEAAARGVTLAVAQQAVGEQGAGELEAGGG